MSAYDQHPPVTTFDNGSYISQEPGLYEVLWTLPDGAIRISGELVPFQVALAGRHDTQTLEDTDLVRRCHACMCARAVAFGAQPPAEMATTNEPEPLLVSLLNVADKQYAIVPTVGRCYFSANKPRVANCADCNVSLLECDVPGCQEHPEI